MARKSADQRPKNVFVLSTGRCGSMTFAKACEHMTNFSSGHETRYKELGDERLNYPDYHIESDNRLSWFLGRLDQKFGDDAVYVHLYRDAESVAESYNKRWTYPGMIVFAYARGILQTKLLGIELCTDYVRTVSENIDFFLGNKKHVFSMDIADPKAEFTRLWKAIGAEGDLDAALSEFDERTNVNQFGGDTPEASEKLDPADYKDKVIFQLSRVVDLFHDERSKLIERARKAEKTAGQQQNRLDEQHKKLTTQERSLADQQRKLDELDGQIIKLNSHLAGARIGRDQLKKSFSYRLGRSITIHLRSPIGWLKMPFSVAKLVFKTLRARLSKQPPSLQRMGVASKASKQGTGPRTMAGSIKRNVYNAYQSSLQDGWKVGRFMLQNSEFESDRRVADLFEANCNRDSDETWSANVSKYLTHYGLHPVFLDEGDEPLFNRLNCNPGYKVNGEAKVSILMPAYNSEKTIETSIRSILSQTWNNLELIVIDDNSTDRTNEIIRRLSNADNRLKLIKNEQNVGPYVAKNIALNQATGDYITGHDADDWAHPQRIEFQIKEMLSQSKIEASVCQMLRIRADGEFSSFCSINATSTDGAAMLASISCMFKISILRDKLGYWDCVRCGADSEMIERAKILLGNKFQTSSLISMICLNNESSLTNDPVFGVRAGKDKGLTPIRISYREAWEEWHKTLKGGDAYIAFPSKERKFEAPSDMLIDSNLIQELIS